MATSKFHLHELQYFAYQMCISASSQQLDHQIAFKFAV